MSGSRPNPPSSNPVRYSPRAEQQVDALRTHYEDKDRLEAARNLQRALDEVELRIASQPEAGLPAPRPYPELARDGEAWTLAGRYWIVYSATFPPVILGVFYDAADIPGRVPP